MNTPSRRASGRRTSIHINIPLEPTSKLVHKATVRLKLLQLFDRWDINGNGTLSVHEIVWGLHIAGIKCHPDKLVRSVYEISLKSGSVTETDLATLKNHEFITFMLLDDQLGGHSSDQQLKYLEIIMEGIKSGSKLESTLKRVQTMELAGAHVGSSSAGAVTGESGNESKETTTTMTATTAATAAATAATTAAATGTTNPQHISITSSSTSTQNHSSTPELYFDINEAKESSWCSVMCKKFQESHKLRMFCYFLLWWFLGTIVYVTVDRWNFFQGLYYSIQSGFSIGFGSLSEEKQNGIDLYHQCYPTANDGNSTLIHNLIVAKQSAYSNVTVNGGGGRGEESVKGGSAEGGNHLLCVYQYNKNEQTALSMLYTVVHICLGAVLIGGILSYFSASSIEASEAWFEEAVDEKHMKNIQKKYAQQSLRNTMSLQWEYTKLWISNHPTSIAAWCLLLLWLCIGAVIFEKLEGGLPGSPFIKGLYFATSAASTGGLAGPSPHMNGSVAFTCFFCLVGVPLYAFSVGEIANLFTEKYFQLKGVEQRNSAITEKEFAWMNRLGDGDNEIDKYEFAMLWFLRNGHIKPEHVVQCQDDFSDLDADSNGVFTKSEMQASMFFEKFDKDHDGNLTSRNIIDMSKKLQQLPSLEYYGKMMLDPNINYNQEKIEEGMLEYDLEIDVVASFRRDKTENKKNNLEQSLSKTAQVVQLNRKEFMQWWSHEYGKYVEQSKTSMLSRMSVSMQTLLHAIDLDNDLLESDAPGHEQ